MALIEINKLQNICNFGYMGFIRKKGVWYFKPYPQYLRHFPDEKKQFEHINLNILADDVFRIITQPEIKPAAEIAA